ncbi:MAG: hypothetical protein ACOYBJ_00205 [Patescibacteria group bacterium]|jgi:hypothetical protein
MQIIVANKAHEGNLTDLLSLIRAKAGYELAVVVFTIGMTPFAVVGPRLGWSTLDIAEAINIPVERCKFAAVFRYRNGELTEVEHDHLHGAPIEHALEERLIASLG